MEVPVRCAAQDAVPSGASSRHVELKVWFPLKETWHDVSADVVLIPVEGGVTAPRGFRAAGVHAGIKRKRKDVCLIVSDRRAAAAGTFTTNQVQAAPLLVTREHIQDGYAQGIVVNSGIANACTGKQGELDARRMAEVTAELVGVNPQDILVGSTGIIGERLPMERLEAGIRAAWSQCDTDGWKDAAEAILTTDTRTKIGAFEFEIDGVSVRIGGIAKGSGMIHPNMATMLAFITTDAAVEPTFLQEALNRAVNKSFNMISVDGDTSTNDMVLVLANGAAGNKPLQAGDPEAVLFETALQSLCIQLAKEIARDGEGATKLVEIQVAGARTDDDARTVARTISRSNLVKTAVYGEDANWGRILCASGYSDAFVDPNRIDIYLGDLQVARGGEPCPFDEEKASEILREPEVTIRVDLGVGEHRATAWTCDLTYEYVKINASYRT